ncbi:MAG: VCBS repeat-containing protein [Kiritimatiellae bacterium]|nr:VCBS repeat-containing protein [Kiritimatiellia bacterium]
MTEVMVSSAITMMVVASVFAVLIQGLRVWEREEIMGELDMDLELALERIRSDLRLSSVGIGLMSFYPDDGSDFIAMSLPLSEDIDDDGLLDRDAQGRILWNQTVIYHIRPGTPDQLLRTEFSPRYMNATPETLYEQLEEVVGAGSQAEIAAAAMSGEVATTKVVFENLVELVFAPPDMVYDCYAPVRTKGRSFNWGSIVLDGEKHKLKLTSIGRNAASSGYNIEVDRIRMSNTASDREGEIYVPANTHPTAPLYKLSSLGMTMSASQRSSGWTFSGNCAAVASGAQGASVEFEVYNDLWCDSNFSVPGAAISSNCSVKCDTSFTNVNPYIPDVVVTMDKGIAWTANSLSDTNTTEIIAGYPLQVTNMVYGGTNDLGAITLNGKWARLQFTGGYGAPTYITNVYLMASGATGVAHSVTFNDGEDGTFVPSLESVWSDWVPDFVINRDDDYLVSLQIGGMGDLDLDLFVSGSSGTILHRENIGTPSVPAWGPNVSPWAGVTYGYSGYGAPAFVDIDSDGDQDLFLGGWQVGQVKYYENSGTLASPNMVLIDADWNTVRHTLSRPTFADIDADGDFDFFTGGQDGYIQFMPNTGTPSEPSWGALDSMWMGLRVCRNNDTNEVYHYIAPAFADIDADGDLDLFVGRYDPGDITMFENVGTALAPAWAAGVDPYGGINVGSSSAPTFGDIDADGDLDMLVGDMDGEVSLFENTGTPASAAWGVTNSSYLGIDVGSWSTPVFANLNPDVHSVHKEIGPAGSTLSFTNEVACSDLICLTAIEVGYPETAIFRSGIFDTMMAAPEYDELNWTHVEEFGKGGDVDIRVRSSDLADMSDLTDADWQDARFGDDGYFQGNVGNGLSSLPRRRYVQYEALFRCFKSEGHTNAPTAILRDVTIDWPGPVGLVDFVIDFGKGPDCGIVVATVDGRDFVKGVSLEMEIYKQGRVQLFSAEGKLEVRPLNTGK